MKKNRPLFWFYILVTYVFIQFSWWTYELFQLNNEVYHLKTELNLLKGEDPAEIISKGNEMNTKLHKRWVMISGEGAVFVALLLLGILQVKKTHKKEVELNQRQKNFLLSVTHELKSPVASAKLQLQTLLKHQLPKEKQDEIIKNTIKDTERLNTLIENILFVSKIETGINETFFEWCNVSEFIETLIKQRTVQFSSNHHLITKIDYNLFWNIDKHLFTSVIYNLIENAIKYSPYQTEIKIELKSENNKLFFIVSDNGIGIPETEKPKVFDKFYRIGNEETRNSKGTGLGLYIVNHIVNLHNGKISISSNTPKGTIFTVELAKS